VSPSCTRPDLRFLALTLLLAPSIRAAGPLAIEGARLTLEARHSLRYSVTLAYRGDARMDARLIDGRFLIFDSNHSTFMDRDLLVDDQLRSIAHFTEEWDPPLEFRSRGAPLRWDVKASPRLTYTRTYAVRDHAFQAVGEGLFRHEVLAGETSWKGRLHRIDRGGGADGGTRDEHPNVLFGFGDLLYHALVRSLPGLAALPIRSARGLGPMVPDLLQEDPEVYVVVDLRFRDALGLVHRKTIETPPVTLPLRMRTGWSDQPAPPTPERDLGPEPGYGGLLQ